MIARPRRLWAPLVVLVLAAALFLVAGLGFASPGGGQPSSDSTGKATGNCSTQPAASSTVGDPLAANIVKLQRQLCVTPKDYVSWAALGLDYVQQAKNTVNPMYYPKAAGVLAKSLSINTRDNFIADAGMAALKAAEHDFAGALVWAQRGLAIDSSSALLYGSLGDAYTQLGRYQDSYAAIQKEVDLSPDSGSLARASYAWELRGNLALARAAMQRSLQDATSPSDAAYAHYYLGELSFNAGDPRAALAEQALGLQASPTYSALLEGKAKAEAALGQRAAALRDYAQVVSDVPQPQYVIEYGEYLQSLGMDKEAQQQYSLFATELALFKSNGVQLDTDPTLFYADHGDPVRALQYGVIGIKIRPFLEMDDAYAWALHVNGRDREALGWSQQALQTGMRNALFYFHQGMIEKSLGDTAAARSDLATALKINPYFNPLQVPVAKKALADLGGARS